MFRTNQNALIFFKVENQNGQMAITTGQQLMISNIEPAAGQARPVTIQDIEAACEDLARVRKRAEKLMDAVERKRQAILDEHAEELNSLAHDLAVARSVAALNVQYGRELFLKPKTLVFHGIEVGFQKERDKIEMPEEAVLIQRIETMLKAKASTLVRTAKSVVAEAFKLLTPAEKQMLGCRQIAGADKVVVRAQAQSDVEKYFAACTAGKEVAS